MLLDIFLSSRPLFVVSTALCHLDRSLSSRPSFVISTEGRDLGPASCGLLKEAKSKMGSLPDLKDFRDSITVKGDTLGSTVIQGRKVCAYLQSPSAWPG
jgi:hypothetical protein